MEPTSFSHFRSFKSPVTAIWPCLTIPDRLGGWLGEADFDLAREGPILVKTWNGDMFNGRVIAAVPPARLEFAWRPFDFDPGSHVTWRLAGDGPGARLTVTHDSLRSREERDHARLFWRESLDALARFVDLKAPSSEWGGTHPVTIRAFMPRPAADLWPLLSTAAGLGKWVANVEQFEAQPGSAFRFRSRYHGQDVSSRASCRKSSPSRSSSSRGIGWVRAGPRRPSCSSRSRPRRAARRSSFRIPGSSVSSLAQASRLGAITRARGPRCSRI